MSEPAGFPTVALLLERLIGEVQGLRSALETRTASPTPPTEPEGLWTATEAAAYLRCSRSKVYQAAEAATMPSLRVGGHLRFEPEAVKRWTRGESQQESKDVLRFRGR
jgi:excisionase family DNA binding protein